MLCYASPRQRGQLLPSLVLYLHIRGLYYLSYKAPREMIWLLMWSFCWLWLPHSCGLFRPWGQMHFGCEGYYWPAGAIPLVGEPIQIWLLGGGN
jgi:ubiquinol-cytochrome c reductase cytochrome b subunit